MVYAACQVTVYALHAAGILTIPGIADASLERVGPMRVTNPNIAGSPTLSCFSSSNAVSACTANVELHVAPSAGLRGPHNDPHEALLHW